MSSDNFIIKVFKINFGLITFSSIFFILSIVLYYLMFDYAITPFADISKSMVTDVTTIEGIDAVVSLFGQLYTAFDWIFLFLVIDIMISACVAAIQARTLNPFSFIGMVLFGNVIFIYLLSFAVEIKSWIMSQFAYNMLLTVPETPFMTFWATYDIYILSVFMVILLVLNQLDMEDVRTKLGMENQNTEYSSQDLRGSFVEK